MGKPSHRKQRTGIWAFVAVTGWLLAVAGPAAAQHPKVVNSVLLGTGGTFVNGFAIAGIDPSGDIYVNDYPASNGTFLAKIAPDGTVLQTFPLLVQALQVGFDGSGNVYVLFPGCVSTCPTPTASFGAGNQGFTIGKLNASGTGFVWLDRLFSASATGFGSLVHGGMVVDPAGDVYLAGYAPCSFTATPGSFEQKCAASGTAAAFAAKIDSSGTKLDYATFLTGTMQNNEILTSMAVDGAGNLYITGTGGSDWPTTPGAFETTCSGQTCSFIAKLNPSGSALSYSTFLSEGAVGSIAVDNQGNAYVAGTTADAGFPTTSGSAEPTFSSWSPTNGSPMPAFAIKLKPDGSGLVYSTYVSLLDIPDPQACGYVPQVALDTADDAYVYGSTWRPNVITGNAIQSTDNNPQSGEGAFAVLNPQGSAFLYSSYLGGTAGSGCDNKIQALTISSDGLVHMTGLTVVNNFPALASTGPVGNPNCQALGLGIACGDDLVPFTMTLQASGTGPVPILFDGDPTPYMPSSANEENFGDACAESPCGSVSATAQGTVYVGNYGAADQPVGSIATTGDFAEANNCPVALAPGAECVITVTFQPTSIGALTGTLTLSGGTTTEEFELDGTGLGAQIEVSPSSLSFGDQSVGTTSAPQTVTVANTSSEALDFTSISTMGDFSESNNCGSGLPAGGSCQVQVAFAPTAGDQRTGNLSIVSALNGTARVQLTGNGVEPDFTIGAAQAGSTSETVAAGQTATYNLALAAVGGFSGTVSLTCSGAPAGASCSVSPASVNLSGSTTAGVTVSVTTTSRSVVGGPAVFGPRGVSPQREPGWFWMMALGMLTAGFWLALRRRRMAPVVRLLSGVALLAMVTAAGCGGGGSTSGTAAKGTPAGTYTIAVQASSGSAGHTEDLTLVVK